MWTSEIGSLTTLVLQDLVCILPLPGGADVTGVVGVGAADRDDVVPGYSNFGTDIVDPGGADNDAPERFDRWIWSVWSSQSPLFDCFDPTVQNGQGTLWVQAFFGTSYAAAHVSAAAAVLQSNIPGKRSWTDLSRCLLASADDVGAAGPDALSGRGRLNVLLAARCGLRVGENDRSDKSGKGRGV